MQTLTCMKCEFQNMTPCGIPKCTLPGLVRQLPHLLTSLDLDREQCVQPDKQAVIDGAMHKAQEYEERAKRCVDTAELAMNTQHEAAVAGGAR